MTQSKFVDLHLSAYSISKSTIVLVEDLGFVRDEFFGVTHCDATEYHGTYRGDNIRQVFEQASVILKNDTRFEGDLELEGSKAQWVKQVQTLLSQDPIYLTPLKSQIPNSNSYKKCDIHININMNQSSAISVYAIEQLELAGFKRVKDGNIHLITTPTFESLEIAEQMFDFLYNYLLSLPNLTAKIKMERITDYLRVPESGRCLPMVSSSTATEWLKTNSKNFDISQSIV
jgi:hypothetical protein